MNVIQINGLTKAYGGTRAVDGLNMRVGQGDIYGFVGKNGAGKSTTMKMIAGLVTPTSGSIKLFDEQRADGGSRAVSRASERSSNSRACCRISRHSRTS